jgi:protein ImuB
VRIRRSWSGGASAAFLAPLPVQALQDPEVTALLLRLGVRTLGELATLGAARLRERFGEHGARLHALAAGRTPVRRAAPPDPELAAEVEFESPLDSPIRSPSPSGRAPTP